MTTKLTASQVFYVFALARRADLHGRAFWLNIAPLVIEGRGIVEHATIAAALAQYHTTARDLQAAFRSLQAVGLVEVGIRTIRCRKVEALFNAKTEPEPLKAAS